ncbi:MAG: beta-N-acetylhexosaminidase [bacterium]|nr:beta-N-acetylhexosaminidase [bacterium]
MKRAISVRSIDEFPWRGSEFPTRLETALARVGVRVKFFELDQYEEQAYKVEIGRGGVIVYGRGVRGLAYGAETLRQVLSQCGGAVPCGVIEDGPKHVWRAVWLDLHVHKYRVAYMKTLCTELGRMKYNALVLNYHDTFSFKKEAYLRGELHLTMEQVGELQKAAQEAGIEVIPYVGVLGRLDHVVELERYRGLRNSDGCLDVRNPRSIKVMCNVVDDIIAAHGSSMIGLGVPMPLERGLKVDEATLEYLGELVGHVVRRGKSALVCAGGEVNQVEWLARLPKNTLIGYAAADGAGLQRVAEACGKQELRVVGVLSGRGARDTEWHTDLGAAIELLQSEVSALAAAGVTRAVVALPSGCGCMMPARPAPSALCGARMMHVSMSMAGLGAAAEFLWSECPEVQRVQAAWPLFWWGVDDPHYHDLAAAYQVDPFASVHTAEVVRRCKRAIKLAGELKPARHVEELSLYQLYARLVLHAVHVRQAFSHGPRRQQVNLLREELERLKDLHKEVLSRTLYRREIQEEQTHLFGHTEQLLARLKHA